MSAILRVTRGIGTGAASVDLINVGAGIHIVSWLPTTATYKGDALLGNLVDSPLDDFAESRHARWNRINESIAVNAHGNDQDQLANVLSSAERILRDASKFWRNEWSNDVVYLTVKGKDESSPRYAVLYGGQISTSPDIYDRPFLQRDATSVSGEFTIDIVRGHWASEIPGSASCVGVQRYSTLRNFTEWMQATLGVGEENEDAVVCWPLNDTSGTTAQAIIQTSWDGTYTGSFTVDNDKFIENSPAATFNDTGYVNLSGVSSLLSRWNNGLNDEGGISLWVKASAATWGNTTAGVLFCITDDSGGVDVNFSISKSTVANQLVVRRKSGGNATVSCDVSDEAKDGDWINIQVYWKANSGANFPGYMFVYVNGTLKASTTVGLWQWSVDSDYMRINSGHSSIGVTVGLDNNVAYSHVTLYDPELETSSLTGVVPDIINPQLWQEGQSCYGQAIANQYSNAMIDYVYVRDNSPATWTNESTQAVPYDLLPSVPAGDDALYLGSEDNAFGGAMFNITGGYGFTMDWEYWNGSSWTSLSNVVDPSDGLHVDGEVSVSWDIPSDWAANNPGMGVTAYWVRAYVTPTSAEPGTAVAPEQNSDMIFTLSKPYVDTQDTDIGGDIPALGMIKTDFLGPKYADLILVGKRSLSRGREFSAYLNAGTKNIPPGVTATAQSDSSIQNDLSYPGSGYIQFDPSGTYSFATIANWFVGSSVAVQYQGTYRAILCVEYPDTMSTGDAFLRLRYHSGYILTSFPSVTPDPDSQTAQGTRYIDMGIFSVPKQAGGYFNINLQATVVTAGTWTMNIISLILVPIDEWSAEVAVPASFLNASTEYVGLGTGDSLVIDSTGKTDLHGRTQATITDVSQILPNRIPPRKSNMDVSITGPVELDHEGQSRYWFFMRNYGNYSPAELNYASVSMEGVKRYLGLRGDR